MKPIAYGRQCIDSDDIESVVDVLKSDYLTTGPKVLEFENAICNVTNSKFCVAVNSGTSALHLASKALLSQGDKVLTTPISFVATSNSVLYADATPLFVDIDENAQINLNICEDILKNDTSVKFIYTVHFTGLASTLDGLKTLQQKYGVKILEDSAHALGSTGAGSVGDLSIWSFHPVKHITTGEGGAITTNDEKLYEAVRLLSTHGITKKHENFINLDMAFDQNGNKNHWYYEQHDLGYNFRISDINCALGVSQISKLNSFVERRRNIAKKYDLAFCGSDIIRPLYIFEPSSSYHLYVVLFDFKKLGMSKSELFSKLNSKNIFPQVHYIPINTQPYYKNLGFEASSTPNALKYYEQAVSLPMYASLSDIEQDYVIDTMLNLLTNKI